MDNKKTSDRIKHYRHLNKMTQKQLSEKSGVTLTSLKKYEGGQRNPQVENLNKIAVALGVDITQLIDDNSTVANNVSFTSGELSLIKDILSNVKDEIEADLEDDNGGPYDTTGQEEELEELNSIIEKIENLI